MPVDRLASAPPPDASVLTVLVDWWQRVLHELSELISSPEKFVALFLVVVIATVVSAVVIWLAKRIWDLLSRSLTRLVLRLGTVKGLRRFAVAAYLRRVREEYGTVNNIYLEREDRLDLKQVFVPLRLYGRDTDGPLVGAAIRDTRPVLTDPGNRRLMILGTPGSGKTTLMKALAVRGSGMPNLATRFMVVH